MRIPRLRLHHRALCFFVALCTWPVIAPPAKSQPASGAAVEVACPQGSVAPHEIREALVVVNDHYDDIDGASGAPPDDLIGVKKELTTATATLCKLGFHVVSIENATQDDLLRAMADFSDRIQRGANVGLIYYAGHGGLAGNMDNWLLPNFNEHTSYADWKDFNTTGKASLSWPQIQSSLSGSPLTYIFVISDACRIPVRSQNMANVPTDTSNDPIRFVYLYSAGKNRSADAGTASGTYYSNSVFRAMLIPGLTVDGIFRLVSSDIDSIPPSLNYDNHPSISFGASGDVLGFIFLPDTSINKQPRGVAAKLDFSAISTQGQTLGLSGGAGIMSFAELATDHQFELLFWRLRDGASRPAGGSPAAFYDALSDLQAGRMKEALTGFEALTGNGDRAVAREAKANLGWMFATGRAGQRSTTTALKYWKEADKAGSAAAIDSLGVVYRTDDAISVDRGPYNKWGLRPNNNFALEYFRRVKDELPAAKTDLAYMYEAGLGVRQNDSLAQSLMREAAADGEPNAMVWLSALEWESNRADAQAWLRKAALELHDPEAVGYWAHRYVLGQVEDSKSKVEGELAAASETGNGRANYWYGYFLACDYMAAHDSSSAQNRAESSPRADQSYGLMKAAFLRSAKAGYDKVEAQESKFNAFYELAALHAYEDSGRETPILPGACPASLSPDRPAARPAGDSWRAPTPQPTSG